MGGSQGYLFHRCVREGFGGVVEGSQEGLGRSQGLPVTQVGLERMFGGVHGDGGVSGGYL